MEREIASAFGEGLISEICFSESNPAKIEKVEIKKEGGKLKETVSTSEIFMNRGFLGSESPASAATRMFFIMLRFSSETKELKYFRRSWISRMFRQSRPSDLAAEIAGFEWAIVPSRILEELMKLPDFEPAYSDGEIRLAGKLGECVVYESEEAEGVFLGDRDSVGAAFGKGVRESRDGSYIQAGFEKRGRLKKLWIS